MRTLHLVNAFSDACGGSEVRTLALHALLRDAGADVRLWSPGQPHPALAREHAIMAIDAREGSLPRGGTVVFVGIYFAFGEWLAAAAPERIVVIVNTNNPAALAKNLARLKQAGHERIELAMTSTALWRAMGRKGVVLPSYIDVSRFPAAQRSADRPFTIGRLSRDEPFKHHPEDAIVYQDVLRHGGAVRLMGATRMQPQPRPSPRLHISAAGSEPAERLLSGLDVFFYRTDPSWFETFGRVTHEAMCAGLPVLCHRSVGGTEFMRHGVDGLLFDSTGEALDWLDRLRREPAWGQALGAAARERMLQLHGVELRRATLDYLMR